MRITAQKDRKQIKLDLIDYKPDYIEHLIDIIFDAYQDQPEYGEPTRKHAKRYINWLSKHSNFFKILLLNGKPIGFIVADLEETPTKKYGEIHELAIKKEFWGFKLGDYLLDKAIDFLKEKGAEEIVLWVGKTNDKAISFYKKRGFEPVLEAGKWLKMVKKL